MLSRFQDFTAAPGTRSCICAVCNRTGVMKKLLPQLPQSLDQMPAAVTVTLMSPEGRKAWRPVLGMYDGLRNYLKTARGCCNGPTDRWGRWVPALDQAGAGLAPRLRDGRL